LSVPPPHAALTAVKAVGAAAALAAGLALGRAGVRGVTRGLGRALLYVVIPYLMVYGLLYTPASLVGSTAALVAAYVGISAAAVPTAYARVFGRGRSSGAAVMASVFPNVAFLPIPLTLILYGNPMPAVMYSTIYNVVSAPLIPTLASLTSGRGVDAAVVARRVASFPFTWAAAAGLALRLAASLAGGPPPPPHAAVLLKEAFSYANIASFALVGEALARVRFGFRREVLAVLAWRLAASPAIHLALIPALLSGAPPAWVAGALIESAAPPATMNVVYARMYGLDEEVVALSIAYSTPASLAVAGLVKALIP